LNLLQKDVAKKLGVCEQSICNWEKNLAKPAIKYIPKIIKFLGYVPFDISNISFGEKIILYRKLHGLSQKMFACQLGIDPCTLRKRERDKRKPSDRFLKDMAKFLTIHLSGSG
jgi:transcriptional regulator with XRE-family HTH domain